MWNPLSSFIRHSLRASREVFFQQSMETAGKRFPFSNIEWGTLWGTGCPTICRSKYTGEPGRRACICALSFLLLSYALTHPPRIMGLEELKIKGYVLLQPCSFGAGVCQWVKAAIADRARRSGGNHGSKRAVRCITARQRFISTKDHLPSAAEALVNRR